MRKIAIIAAREFSETVRTKAFFLGVILLPGILLGLIFGSQWLAELTEHDRIPTRRIVVVDRHGALFDELASQVDRYNQSNPQRPFELESVEPAENVESSLAERVLAGELYAYIAIPQDAVDGGGGCVVGRNDSLVEAGLALQQMINEAVVSVRFRHSDPPIDRQQVARLQQPVPVEDFDVRTGEPAAGSRFARLITPFAFMFMLYMGTFGISWGLLTSVLEEKSSRVVEVLLSAVGPTQLMAGKILGMVLVGGVMLGVWCGAGYAAASARGMGNMLSGARLAFVALYFVPGFLLTAAFLASIGAACNTLKEAQSMASPLSLINIVPMVLWWQISQNPGSTLSVVLSYIPPITPFVMILRICADPHTPGWQIVTTLVLLWAAALGLIWVAGKVFRVGVLMYGKPPSMRELVRWLRQA